MSILPSGLVGKRLIGRCAVSYIDIAKYAQLL